MISASPKGAGKTYNTVQLLTAYEESGFTYDGQKAEMRTMWFSANTIHSKQNAIVKTLKTLDEADMYEITEKNNNIFEDVYQDILSEKQEIEEYNEYRDIYKKFMKGGITKLNDLELMELERRDYIDPKKDPDAPKWLVPRITFWILDDLIGNKEVFSYKRGNYLNSLITRHRHDSPDLVPINLIFITQSFKAIPVIIRKNSDLFVLLKNANRKKVIEQISEEVGSILSEKDFEKYYDYICSVEHGALIISVHKDEHPDRRVRMGWDKILELPSSKCDCVSKGKEYGSCGRK
jgi:nucleoside-triphosphatase THEP1